MGQGDFVKSIERTAKYFGLLATFALLLLALPAGASAVQTHVLDSFVATPTQSPGAVAIDDGSGGHAGYRYVVDSEFGFVNGIDPSGNPVTAFAPPVGLASSVVVDTSGGPSSGDVYVGVPGQPIEKYAPDGTLIETLSNDGLALTFDPSTEELYVIHSFNYSTFNSSGVETSSHQEGNFMRYSRAAAVGNGKLFTLGESLFNVWQIEEFDAATGEVLHVMAAPEAQGLAYDPSDNQLFVDEGTFVTDYEPGTFTEVDRFGSGVLAEGRGIAIDPATGIVTVIDKGNGGRIDTFVPANLPDVTTGGASSVTKTTAAVVGHVGPAGAGEVTNCSFRFGTTEAYSAATSPAPCDQPTPYSTDTNVTATLIGLAPATKYHLRLFASNSAGAGSSPDVTFTTAPDVPLLNSSSVIDRNPGSIEIEAKINAMGANTEAFVEFGDTEAYGSRTAAKVVNVSDGADQGEKSARLLLSGLTPNHRYHYRVVLTNAAGTNQGNDQTASTYPLNEYGLPDGRGYELVSPVNKNAHTIPHEYGIASDNGEGILYPATIAIGDASSGNQTFAVARRSADGWTPASPFARPNINSALHFTANIWASDDLAKIAFSGLGYVPTSERSGAYISNLTSTVEASAGTLDPPVEGPAVSTGLSAPEFLSSGKFLIAGASPSLDRLYFSFDGALLEDESARAQLLATKDVGGFYVFEDGTLKSAGILPDGTLDPDGAVPAATPTTTDYSLNSRRQPSEFRGQVSADGTRAFFVSPDPAANSSRPSELYVHRAGQPSLLVSGSKLSGQPSETGVSPMPHTNLEVSPDADSSYAAASKDGSFVSFESTGQLTSTAPADSSVKGYLFNVETGQLTYLPGVEGSVVDVSENGSRVFFVANGMLQVWQDSAGVAEIASGFSTAETIAITPTGSSVIFTPIGAPPSFNNGGMTQVYRYEVDSAKLECLSCLPEGIAATAPSFLADDNRLFASPADQGQLKAPHYIADGGRRVFFETAQPLVGTDTNGASDVYEWEDGAVHLISGGASSEGSFLLDNSASGDDVFFVTAESLVKRDTEGSRDVYDARVGAAGEAAEKPACGSSCQGEPGTNSAPTPIGSESVSVPAGQRTLTIKVGIGKGSTSQLKFTAPGRGKVSAWGPDIRRATRSIPRPGGYEMSVTLNRKAKQRLRKTGRLVTRVNVQFKPAQGQPTTSNVSITFKA
jgi:hypothetical protein